jgi:DNA-binding protein HU-beta
VTPNCRHAFCPPARHKETIVKTADLIDHVASKAGLEKGAARKAVEAVLTGIVEAAKKGDEVTLVGFGKFKVKNSPARQGRNPATGATIEIAASRKLGFHAGQAGEGRTRRLTPAVTELPGEPQQTGFSVADQRDGERWYGSQNQRRPGSQLPERVPYAVRPLFPAIM